MSQVTPNGDMLLEVNRLRVHFPIRRGVIRRRLRGYVKAVDGVSFFVRRGETLGLVGESGCGKTTTGRSILRILAPTDGEILYHENGGTVTDLAKLRRHDLKSYHRQIRMIFQDPYSSLNPRMTLLDVVGEPLRNYHVAAGRDLVVRVAALLRRVGLRPEYMRRYPHAFSGGERQRIGIARALALNPRLVICDEPVSALVSALDVSVRAQILNLLGDLQQEFDLTYLFIAHDLSVVEYIADRVAVMYLGRIVELAPTAELYVNPKHPYTEALLSAVPKPDPRLRGQGRRIMLEGEVPDPANPPSGCHFHTRCPYAQERCRRDDPPLRDVGGGHLAACHFAEELSLRGVAAADGGGRQ